MPGTPGVSWETPLGAVASGSREIGWPPGLSNWPTLWARCWSRIRTWGVPPRWSPDEWWAEARAQGVLAACEAQRSFQPGRLVPLDAFLYRRVVESVWTRYRQEWSFARRCRPATALAERPAAGADRPDPDLLDRLAFLLGQFGEVDRRLLRWLFWDGRPENDIARELGVTRQAVNLRKQRLLQWLRSEFLRDRDV